MNKIEIKSITQEILFTYEIEENNISKTVEEAIRREVDLSRANLEGATLEGANLEGATLEGATLRSANLEGANLEGANLEGATLRSANLEGANLEGANLEGATLRSANLRSANLEGANLEGANLEGANLYCANLEGANLEGANLYCANLEGATLRSANLEGGLKSLPVSWVNECSRDILFVFQCLKGELPFLRERIISGQIDGTAYEGECACLIGSLGKANGGIDKVCSIIPFYEKGLHNPCEQFFYQIRVGDTPEKSVFAAWALKLVDMVLIQETLR